MTASANCKDEANSYIAALDTKSEVSSGKGLWDCLKGKYGINNILADWALPKNYNLKKKVSSGWSLWRCATAGCSKPWSQWRIGQPYVLKEADKYFSYKAGADGSLIIKPIKIDKTKFITTKPKWMDADGLNGKFKYLEIDATTLKKYLKN
jgi:hypothetical protein